MKTSKYPLKAILIACLLLMAKSASAQVTHVQYYDSLRLITHDQAKAKYIEFIERAHEDAMAGMITLYKFGPDTADYVMLEKGSYDTVFQPRKVHGQLLKWYPNGHRQSIKNYAHGKADGLDAEWHENDSLRHEIYFAQGQYDGTLKTYYRNGKLRREELYQNGKQVYGRYYNEEGKEIAFVPYREKPNFPGGEPAMLKYLSQHIRYPAVSAKKGISGLVVLRFVVDRKGTISQIQVEKRVSEELDAEAVRVVKTMPAWEPGKLEGEPVEVLYHLPVRFSVR